jgi:hypothetical protein
LWCGVGAAALVLIAAGFLVWRHRRPGGGAKRDGCAHARELAAGAEALAHCIAQLHDEDAPPAAWLRVSDERDSLTRAAYELHERAAGEALRRAAADLADTLTLVGWEVSRVRAMAAVPEVARRDAQARFAAARLRQRVAEVVFAARFLGIVVDVEGAD